MIDTQCPNCGTPVTDKDADVEKGILQCPFCDEALSLLEEALEIEDKSYKETAGTVEGISIEKGNQLILNITPKASGLKWPPLVLGLIFVGGPILLYYFEILSFTVRELLAFIVLLVLFIVGIVALATGIKRLFRHTRIELDKQNIVFHYKLFGWLPIGGEKIAVNNIKQFFVNEFKEGTKPDGAMLSYKVKALLPHDRETTLVSGLREPSSAFFIEEQLESYLEIKDRVMPGEYIPDNKADKTRDYESNNTSRTEEEYWVKLNMASQKKSYVFVNCKSCGVPLEDASFNIDANLIQCQKCKSLEKLDTTVFSAENAEAWLKKEKATALPKNITIEEGHGLDIKIKHPFHVGGFQVWGLIVCAFLLYDRFYIPGGSLPFEDIRITYLVYLVAFLWGAWSIYSVVRMLGFRTIIEVRSTHIRIYDYLLNRFKQNEAQLNRSEFDQLFVENRVVVKTDKDNRDYEINFFDVFARLKDGQKYLIMEDLPELDQAHYIEHKIESFLGIEDEIIDQSYQPDFKKRATNPRNLMDVYKLFKEYPKRMY